MIPSAPLRTCSSSSAGPWTPPRASSQDPGRKPGRSPKRGPRPRDPRLASANSHAGFSFSATTDLISHQFLLDLHQVVKLRFQSRPISLYPPPCSHGVLRTKEAQTESSSLSCRAEQSEQRIWSLPGPLASSTHLPFPSYTLSLQKLQFGEVWGVRYELRSASSSCGRPRNSDTLSAPSPGSGSSVTLWNLFDQIVSGLIAGTILCLCLQQQIWKFTSSRFLKVSCLNECVNFHLNHPCPVREDHGLSG